MQKNDRKFDTCMAESWLPVNRLESIIYYFFSLYLPLLYRMNVAIKAEKWFRNQKIEGMKGNS